MKANDPGASDAVQALGSEVQRLADQVTALSARIRKIEEILVSMSQQKEEPVRRENPHDRKAVTEKVRFDWQD